MIENRKKSTYTKSKKSHTCETDLRHARDVLVYNNSNGIFRFSRDTLISPSKSRMSDANVRHVVISVFSFSENPGSDIPSSKEHESERELGLRLRSHRALRCAARRHARCTRVGRREFAAAGREGRKGWWCFARGTTERTRIDSARLRKFSYCLK